jgi:hypothetical protein
MEEVREGKSTRAVQRRVVCIIFIMVGRGWMSWEGWEGRFVDGINCGFEI